MFPRLVPFSSKPPEPVGWIGPSLRTLHLVRDRFLSRGLASLPKSRILDSNLFRLARQREPFRIGTFSGKRLPVFSRIR